MIVDAATKITFTFIPGSKIRGAFLVGTFNDWDITADPMTPREDGSFQITKALPCGHYEYKFYADDIYWNDPDAYSQTLNSYGTLNSVLVVTVQ